VGVGTAPTWMRGMTSGGTNLPAAEPCVTRWFESKSSDTGEGEVKSVNVVSIFRENIKTSTSSLL